MTVEAETNWGGLPREGAIFVSVANRDKRAMLFPVKRLVDLGFTILATAGTAAVLKRNGIEATLVRKLTERTREHEGEKSIVELIQGGTVVTATDMSRADVAVSSGRIAAVGALNVTARETLDASGLLVMPGGVDSHVHLDQWAPGGEMCDNFLTGTTSAAAGGTTTVVTFSWQTQGNSLAAITADYHRRARQAIVDYTFHLTVTDATPTVVEEELPRLIAEGSRSMFLMPTSALWSLARSRSRPMTSFLGRRSYSPVSLISSSFLSRAMDFRIVTKLVRVPPSHRWLT